MQSYTDELYRLMARLGVQEEEKLLVLKYVSGLSPYIQQEMEFLTVKLSRMHSAMLASLKQSRKEKNASRLSQHDDHSTRSLRRQPIPTSSNAHLTRLRLSKIRVRDSQRDKRECSKQPPAEKWCDYHHSSWHDASECKARKTFLAKLSTSNLTDKAVVESDSESSTLLASTVRFSIIRN